jgi:hypothetical protein
MLKAKAHGVAFALARLPKSLDLEASAVEVRGAQNLGPSVVSGVTLDENDFHALGA